MANSTRRCFLVGAGSVLAAPMITGRASAQAKLRPVKIAWNRQFVPAAVVQKGADLAAEAGLQVELVNFTRSLDGMVAMQKGDVFIANCLIGIPQFSLALSKGIELTAISGAVKNTVAVIASRQALPKDQIDEKNVVYIGPDPWKQLVGKKVGFARGSAAEFLLRSSMKANGLDFQKDIQFVDVKSNGDQVLALQQGGIDFAVLAEPAGVQTRIAGYGVLLAYPYAAGEFTRENTPFVVRTDALEDYKAELQVLIDAHVKATKHYQDNLAEWVKDSAKVTLYGQTALDHLMDPERLGLDPKYWANATLGLMLPVQDLQSYAKALFADGFIQQDVSDQIERHLNYSFLSNATGAARADLGG
jgi:ABC-type nitrate/sulfonate/bicarbonate transport system substrate-binding protein